MSINTVTISGNVGKKPMRHDFPNGGSMTRFSIAHNRMRGRGEDAREETDWWNCSAWGPVGDFIATHVQKGHSVTVSGRLVINRYVRQGETEETKTPEIEVSDIQLGAMPSGKGDAK